MNVLLVSSVGTAMGRSSRAANHNASENACRRLEMQRGGTLSAQIAVCTGIEVTIIIPAEKDESI